VAYSISVNKLSKLHSVVRLGADNRLVAGTGVAHEAILTDVWYPAGGSQPPTAALNKIMSDVIALQEGARLPHAPRPITGEALKQLGMGEVWGARGFR
jgi:hypothetical protein